MAPSPENDNTPKAPDKNDKAKLETTITAPTAGAQDPENTASGPENKVRIVFVCLTIVYLSVGSMLVRKISN